MAINELNDKIYRIEGLDQTINIAGTTTNYINIPTWARRVNMVCDTAWRLAFGPKLVHALYYTAATTTYTEYTTEVTDATAAHMPLDGMLATDYVYLGVSDPVLGFYFDIGTNVQDEAATLDVEYCSTAMSSTTTIAFTDVAGDSDQTDVAGDTLKQDGEYVFTLVEPARSHLGTYAKPRFSKCYWYRFKPSATLSATTDINQIVPIYQNVTLGYMAAATQYDFVIDRFHVGSWYAQCSGAKQLYINFIA